MKKYLYLLVLVFVASCDKEARLSCDPSIDRWAKEMTVYYSTADRKELVSLPLNRVRAIYRGFPTEKKAELWHEKIRAYSTTLTGSELEAYLQLSSIINHIYTSEPSEDYEEEIKKWEKEMRENFGWNDDKIFFSSCTWLTKEEYYLCFQIQTEIRVRSIHEPAQNEIKECECHYNIGCPGMLLCEKHSPKGCTEIKDCGIVGSSYCNGVCM